MKIVIYFALTDTVPQSVFLDTIESLKEIILSKERSELARIRDLIPDIPEEKVSSALDELSKNAHEIDAFRISAVRPGSVEITILLTALGYWLLDKTIGHTVTEAWKETEMNERIRRFFLTGKKDKLKSIEHTINKPNRIKISKTRRERKAESVKIPMFAKLDEEREEIMVRVNIPPPDKFSESPPTWNEIQ